MILLRLRCFKGWHKLTKYEPIPFITKKTYFGLMVVRAARGKCDICKHEITLHTPATPRWQRGNVILHRMEKWLKS